MLPEKVSGVDKVVAITARQLEVLNKIKGFIAANRYSPSYKEIAAMTGLSSVATVHKHVTILRRKRLIETEHNMSRSISITGACPTCGRSLRSKQ